jgi:hypothetical protein
MAILKVVDGKEVVERGYGRTASTTEHTAVVRCLVRCADWDRTAPHA